MLVSIHHIILIAIVIAIALTGSISFQTFTYVSYDRTHPSKIPSDVSEDEVNVVYQKYIHRTDKDVALYNTTDRNMTDVFYEVLKQYETKESIMQIIYDQHLFNEIMKRKTEFNRIRPYQLDSRILPPQDSDTYHTPSYPAGHAAQAYFTARYFGCKYPERKKELMDIAYAIDETRVRAGIHYPSDGIFARQTVEDVMKSSLCAT
jgi:hypothetical protein